MSDENGREFMRERSFFKKKWAPETNSETPTRVEDEVRIELDFDKREDRATNNEHSPEQRVLESPRMQTRVRFEDAGDQPVAQDPQVTNESLNENRRERETRVSGRANKGKFTSERLNYDHR